MTRYLLLLKKREEKSMTKLQFSKTIIESFEKKFQKSENISLKVGEVIKVSYKLIEAGKERIQTYKGVIIAIQNKGLGKSFTLRRRVQGVGVEQVFLYHSPKIQSIVKEDYINIRRSKLYYLRKLIGKSK